MTATPTPMDACTPQSPNPRAHVLKHRNPQQREWLTDLRAVDPDGRGRDVYLWYPYHMDAIPLVMFGQGPHRDGCPDDTEWRSDPKAPEAQVAGET